MVLINNAVKKRSLFFSTILFSISYPLYALPFDTETEDLRPHEPAMEDIVPPQSLNDIRDIMIKESIEKHGFCACPYSTDALGGPCGTLSAYFIPWNKILCYRRDITGEMIYFYRLERATNIYEAERKKREDAERAATSDERKLEKLAKDKLITSDYFRNSAKPPPNTITLPNNFPNPTVVEPLPTYAGEVTENYFKRTVPVTPARNMTDLIAPRTN